MRTSPAILATAASNALVTSATGRSGVNGTRSTAPLLCSTTAS